MSSTHPSIGVIGLGYVGLPLAVALSSHYRVIGVDCNLKRVNQLHQNHDQTSSFSPQQLKDVCVNYTSDIKQAASCQTFIITVPTPVFKNHQPNLKWLQQATIDVGKVLKAGDLVIFESTICPGTTDNLCVPWLETESGLKVNIDFDCGYSPERISPNDKGLSDAVKVVAGASEQALKRTRNIYQKIATRGLYCAPSIKIAEAAKLTENIQRDVDIAVTNELAMIFSRMGIDSDCVFDAAASKWNFRRFKPGLVGGHCIGTDSYYLLDWAHHHNASLPLLQAARQVNNDVPHFVAQQAMDKLRQQQKILNEPTILIFGFSFKENCPDVRNTLVEPLRQTLSHAGCRVRVCDPVADDEVTQNEYGLILEKDIDTALKIPCDLIIFAVGHRQFANIPAAALTDRIVLDVKNIATYSDWRL